MSEALPPIAVTEPKTEAALATPGRQARARMNNGARAPDNFICSLQGSAAERSILQKVISYWITPCFINGLRGNRRRKRLLYKDRRRKRLLYRRWCQKMRSCFLRVPTEATFAMENEARYWFSTTVPKSRRRTWKLKPQQLVL